MEIVKAKPSQLLEILYITRECAYQLKDKGVKYWHNTHTDYAQIQKDIEQGYVFILTIKKGPVGTMTVKPDPDIEQASYLDRLSIFPHFQRRGLGKLMIDFAEEHARKNGHTLLRGTTPVNDQSLCRLLEGKGFLNKGIAHHVPNELIKIVFEKNLV
ncbi:MAG: GNAT family N-acetyltransferase [Bacteroidales bacterium]|nr:GNAT family N-acetyltransferase [Bacteroidales bacterium]MDD3893012.1 GNAT family N-acetyltransferase [Bacteroidales bacterium]